MFSNKILPLRPLFDTTIPSVFNDYLTYYEQLANVISKINEIINELDSYNEEFLELAKEYTDQQIASLRKAMEDADEAIKNDYNNKIALVNQAISEMQLAMAALDVKVATLYTYWNQYQQQIDGKFDLMYQNLKQFILDNIATLTNVMVTNPITGKWENINKVLEDIWRATQWVGITVLEFDGLRFTAQEFDALMITAYNMDYYARLVLFKYIYLRMRSPFTGKFDTYENIINRLAAFHMNGITASEFDALMEVVQTFDDMDITAYELDWNGKAILMPSIAMRSSVGRES